MVRLMRERLNKKESWDIVKKDKTGKVVQHKRVTVDNGIRKEEDLSI